MDSKGYETISRALQGAELDATITPEPKGEEDLRYATVETGADIQPSLVLNALHEAGLMHRAGTTHYVQLESQPGNGQPGSLTFEDKAVAARNHWGQELPVRYDNI